ncbi:DUF723 domain-containing protein [Shewanella sp. S1-49-MNA-CIBAN-0167]|uniref:DUF723 domain-containing protein n=1 Tax=Shewanella sp. S1-49-MNA-CIBAN-0167 TaxID=3140468 RepID=UPI00331A2A5E
MIDETTLFIEKSKSIYGDKYTYEKTLFVSGKLKLIITCKLHGDFSQVPSNHYKSGCSECSKERRASDVLNKSRTEFKNKVSLIHGDKYNLSKIDYQGAKKKVTVSCYEHGDFEITAQHLLAGSGCASCGKVKAASKILLKSKLEFDEKSNKVHGNRYDYSKVNYLGEGVKVIIICPQHGEFEKTPRKHLDGNGCNLCEGKKEVNRITEKSFIDRAIKVHNNIYDYSKTIFIKSHKNVTIICKKHGEFQQNPHNHLAGFGCKLCANEKQTKTTSQFINESIIIYGNKFDYSETEYISVEHKVKIKCSIHGFFLQTPTLHLLGNGCRSCSHEKRAKKLVHNTLKFIKVSQQVHDYKWNYDKTEYVRNHEKVIINCDIHGDFLQTPASHKSGKGCPVCGANKSSDSRRLSINEFMATANYVHKNKYSYELVDYQNNSKNVQITCPLHGYFTLSPYLHMRGSGCPICSYEIQQKFTLQNMPMQLAQ